MTIYSSSGLHQLNLLPLMYDFKLQDLMSFIKSLKSPTDNLNILDLLGTPQDMEKLTHSQLFNITSIIRLYNSEPIIDPSLPTITIKHH